MDSITIINKCNIEDIGFNYMYKNKKCIKINVLSNENGYPLLFSLGKGNKNDSELESELINKNKNIFEKNEMILLGDKGYDSSKIRNNLKTIKCDCIIPINKRNTKNNPTKNNPTKNNLIKNNPTKNNPTKNNLIKNNSTKNNLIKNNSTKNNLIKNNSTENNPTKNNLIKNNSTENNPTQNNSIKNNSTEIKIKNDMYYSGLNIDQIKIYSKRIKIEHCLNDLKRGRLNIIRDRKINMFIDSIYCRLIDFKFFKRYK